MNREIKFRGKRTDNNEWVSGNLINWNEKLKPRIIWFTLEGESIYDASERELNFEVSKESIGQYTGLKDKNGVEIYEGDIVAIYDNTGAQQKYVLEYRQDMYQIVGVGGPGEWLCLEELEGCELIRNIHENPELLNTN